MCYGNLYCTLRDRTAGTCAKSEYSEVGGRDEARRAAPGEKGQLVVTYIRQVLTVDRLISAKPKAQSAPQRNVDISNMTRKKSPFAFRIYATETLRFRLGGLDCNLDRFVDVDDEE